MTRVLLVVLVLLACAGESSRESEPTPECSPPLSFPTVCLDRCWPYDGRCSDAGRCCCLLNDDCVRPETLDGGE